MFTFLRNWRCTWSTAETFKDPSGDILDFYVHYVHVHEKPTPTIIQLSILRAAKSWFIAAYSPAAQSSTVVKKLLKTYRFATFFLYNKDRL